MNQSPVNVQEESNNFPKTNKVIEKLEELLQQKFSQFTTKENKSIGFTKPTIEQRKEKNRKKEKSRRKSNLKRIKKQ